MTKISIISLLCIFTAMPVGYSAIPKTTKVSDNDSTAGYLNGKLIAGDGISFTENNDGSNETLTIASTGTGTGDMEKATYDTDDNDSVDSVDQISTLTNGKWCTSDGSVITCSEDAPAGSGDVTSVGDCTGGACLDGSSDGGTNIALYDSNSNKTTITAGDSSGDLAFTLPTTDGNANQVLKTDGSGVLSWVDQGGHDAVTLAGTPNYLTLSSQQITLTKLDVSDDTNLTAGRSLTLSTNDVYADAELYTDFKSITIETPTDADNFFLCEMPIAVTVTRVTGIVEAATSAVLTLQECDSAGDNCSTIEAVTADVDGTISTDIDNAGLDAGDIIRLDVGTVTGTVGQAHLTMTYTKND